MSIRMFALVYMACFAASSMGLYLVKYTVQNIQREVASVDGDLKREKESLHLLKAEWAYLNRPDRLNRLAAHHLEVVPLDSKRMDNMALLPAAHQQQELPEGAKNPLLVPVSQVQEEN